MMQRTLAALMTCAALIAVPSGAVRAAQSKDEKNLDKELARLEATVAKPDGERAVLGRIEADFKVSTAQVQALLDRGLGYGEAAIVFSLAQSMPGGITDANVQSVVSLRQGPPTTGWGAVARQARVKLGRAVSQVRKINNESHRAIKQEHAAASPASRQPAAAEPVPHRPAVKRPFTGEGRSLPQGRAAD